MMAGDVVSQGLGVVCRGLAVGRTRPLIEGVDVAVRPGEVLAVLGPSGVGKSTLLDTIEGRVAPWTGAVQVHDTDGRPLGVVERGRRIARVEQDLLLVDTISLEHNVLLGRLDRYPWWRTFLRFPRHEREAARAVLARIGLGHLWWKPAATVSGGERQRTALTRALFSEPDLLLADEPTAGLDADTAEVALGLVVEHARRRPAAVIVVLHDPALAERHADRVLRLDEGRAVVEERRT
jgi:phosphonate transport system ATP-binding protein